MTVVAIHVGPVAGAPLRAVRSVPPLAGTGLERDRHVHADGAPPGQALTSHFRIGPVLCYGVEICEPCLHLQQLTRPGIIRDLVRRGGPKPDILNDGSSPSATRSRSWTNGRRACGLTERGDVPDPTAEAAGHTS
jgi:hypothetical protein